MPNRVFWSHHFFARAREFFRAFLQLQPHDPPDWPRYFLLCHAVELALKAYLLWCGTGRRKLRHKYGHDLTKLVGEATKLGLPLAPHTAAEIDALNEAYMKNWPRYPEHVLQVCTIDQFEIYARDVITAVYAVIHPPAQQGATLCYGFSDRGDLKFP
jgi:HEPN domain-containing protein